MQKIILFIFMICVIGCSKNDSSGQALAVEKDPAIMQHVVLPIASVDKKITLEELVGKWMLLNSESDIDISGDYLLLKKDGAEYRGVLVYQNSKSECSLIINDGRIFLIAKTGEKYIINRLQSREEKRNNGIAIDLVTEFDDIGLGYFQREDILKQ